MKKISYIHKFKTNIGTEEEPNIIETKHNITVGPFSDDRLDKMLELAKQEAYGKITIEDDGQSEPEPTELEQLRADLDFISVMTGVSL